MAAAGYGDAASMGPPPFGDGKPRNNRQGRTMSNASMGPPPFGDGKVESHFSCSHVRRLLQWGHRLSAMERVKLTDHTSLGLFASMGPPPFGDGKRDIPTR